MKLSLIKKENRVIYSISYLGAFIPRLVLIILYAYPLRVGGDELFLLALPAKLAGYDWSSLMGQYRYYGYGISVFFTIFFKYVDDPIILYRVMLIMIAIIQSTISLIVCYIFLNFLKIESKKYIAFAAIGCSYCVSLYPTYMYNEHIYTVCIWTSILFICFLIKYENIKHLKLKYSIFLALSFIYALTIHARAITLWIAFIILYFFIYLLFSKKLVEIIPFSIVSILGYYVNKKIMELVIVYVKGNEKLGSNNIQGNIEEIPNTAVSFKIPTQIFMDRDYQRAWFSIIIGQINTWNFFVGGMAIFSIILGLYLLYSVLKKQDVSREKKLALYIWIFCMAAIFITIGGQSFSWLYGVTKALKENNFSADAMRALVYLRYLIAYFPPVLLIVFYYLYINKEIYIKLFSRTFILNIICISIWMKLVLPNVINEKVGIGNLGAFSWTKFTDDIVGIANYFPGILLTFIILYIIYVCCKKNKSNLIIMLFCILFFYQYVYKTVVGDGVSSRINYSYTDATVKIIEEANRQLSNLTIFMPNESIPRTGQSPQYIVQYLKKNLLIHSGFPDNKNKNEIFFCVNPKWYKDLQKEGFQIFQLDENEYAYIRGEKLEGLMKNYKWEGNVIK